MLLEHLDGLRQNQLAVHALGGHEAHLTRGGEQFVEALEAVALTVGNPVIFEVTERNRLSAGAQSGNVSGGVDRAVEDRVGCAGGQRRLPQILALTVFQLTDGLDGGVVHDEHKLVVSVESLEDEFGYTAVTVPSIEDDYIDREALSEAQRVFLRKVEQLIEVSPKHGLALLLMALDISGAEFADKLQLGHDAANKVRQQVVNLAPGRIDGLSQIDVESLKANQSKRSEYYREEANRILDMVLAMYFDR